MARLEKAGFKREIAIAVIGLIGVLATALLSNWEKLFSGQKTVLVKYAGYQPTGNFETELRYYFDVSGTRSAVEAMQKQIAQNAKESLIRDSPAEAAEIIKVFDAASAESIKLDDVIKELLPVYQKHFTLEEIQALNKLYSSEVMQSLVKKMPLLTQDAAPIQARMLQEYYQRLEKRLSFELKS